MHQPEATPRPSVYYRYQVHPFCRPAEMDGATAVHPVVVVGAGPVGLVTALNLARFGVRCVVLEAERQLCHGSRAIVLTRRSQEILQQAGVIEPFLAKGLPWHQGRSYFRGREVYRMVLTHDPEDRFQPGLNLQQQYIEEYLLEACARTPLIELRWASKVTALAQDADGATLTVDTPEGEYPLRADYVVAADGGRSALRRMLGLRMEGRSYAGNFVIADIKAPLGLPTERLCFFEPDWSPGNNVLVHRQPDDIWRLDYRLPDGETAEEALAPERLHDRICRILAMVGRAVPYQLDWATVYSASTLTLPDYVVGRICFVGDAAHLLPIFGVRGANTGLQDAENLAWKLAFTLRGLGGPALLRSYSDERVAAAREICEEAGKSTRFMTPPTAGFRLMRDAVLSLTLTEDFPKDLLHWRTSRPHSYHGSALNSVAADDAGFQGGPACGDTLRNARLAEGDYLFDRLGTGFHLLAFAGAAGPDAALTEVLAAAAQAVVPVRRVLVAPRAFPDMADVWVADPDGRLAARYAARPGAAYLARPDLHVCARWPAATPAQLRGALATACGAPAR